MQRNQQAYLPGESVPGIFPRRRTFQPAVPTTKPHISAMQMTGAPRHQLNPQVAPPMLPPVAYATREQGYRVNDHARIQRQESLASGSSGSGGAGGSSGSSGSTGAEAETPPPDSQRTAIEQGRKKAQEAISADFRAGRSIVNVDDYFLATLGQFKDDSAVMNPMNISLQPVSKYMGNDEAVDENATDTELLLTQLADKIATKSSAVDVVWPIGHSAIDDTRIYFDTLVAPQTYGGYLNGVIPMQFNDFNGISPPDRIVKIIMSPFNFPHVYLPTSTVFDLFYFRSVFMSIYFVPTTHMVQPKSPNDFFTFEMYVNNIDSTAVYLVPIEPTFCLKQPVNVTGDLTIHFQVRSPTGSGFINCPIPPTRIHVRRTSAPPGGPTTFTLDQGQYIGVLAPAGVLYTVPVLFQQWGPVVPLTPLETLLINSTGFPAGTFVAGPPGTFTVPIDTSAIPLANEDFYIFIPKNGISFTLRFSSLQPTKTNDLFPVHE